MLKNLKVVNVSSALCKDLHFPFPGSIEESIDVGVFTCFKRFIRLCVSVGPRLLYAILYY